MYEPHPATRCCSLTCSWSVAVNQGTVTQTTALVQISLPELGGTWAFLRLSVCATKDIEPNWDECDERVCEAEQVR